jgi:hypothetical protein
MGKLRCVDGTILTVTAVACSDRVGTPYEMTLDLKRGRKPFASIGERCGFRLSELAASVAAAREDPAQAEVWPDPDDRFPDPDIRNGPPPLQPDSPGPVVHPEFRPGEREYFSLRSRERADLPGTGEIRCLLRDSVQWLGERRSAGSAGSAGSPRSPGRRGRAAAIGPVANRPGGWCLTRRAVIEAWGTDGIGVRAVLTSAELVTFLDTVLKEPGGVAVTGRAPAGAKVATVGMRLASIGKPAWRQRGRVRDEATRSRLPAIRAQNRSIAFASGDPQARRGDVRR